MASCNKWILSEKAEDIWDDINKSVRDDGWSSDEKKTDPSEGVIQINDGKKSGDFLFQIKGREIKGQNISEI